MGDFKKIYCRGEEYPLNSQFYEDKSNNEIYYCKENMCKFKSLTDIKKNAIKVNKKKIEKTLSNIFEDCNCYNEELTIHSDEKPMRSEFYINEIAGDINYKFTVFHCDCCPKTYKRTNLNNNLSINCYKKISENYFCKVELNKNDFEKFSLNINKENGESVLKICLKDSEIFIVDIVLNPFEYKNLKSLDFGIDNNIKALLKKN